MDPALVNSGVVSVRYIVEDVESAVVFYTNHFGFQPEVIAAPAFASIIRGNLRLLLSGAKSSAGRTLPDGTKPVPGGWNRIQLEVLDINAEASRLRAAGVKFRSDDIVSGPGGSQFWVVDPSGNLVELFQPTQIPIPSTPSISNSNAVIPVGVSAPATPPLAPDPALASRKPARVAAPADPTQQLEAFAYTVSHDFCAPLRAIKGFTNALLEDYSHLYDDEGKMYAKRAVEGTERMERMISALLAYSRVGRGEIQIDRVELEESLTNLSKGWVAKAQQQNGSVEISHPLPAVMGNPALLEQAMNQLVTNSLIFVPEGGNPRVHIATEKIEDLIRIKVQDNGIGIQEKHFSKLFQIFQRFNAADKYPGIGIGLAIARKAVERMGGRMAMESEYGKGSCFWIDLPEAS